MKTTRELMNQIAEISDKMGRNIEVDKKGSFVYIATDLDTQMTSYIGSSDVMYSMLMSAMLDAPDLADTILQVAQDYALSEVTKQSMTNSIN
jgi:hypothetical protein